MRLISPLKPTLSRYWRIFVKQSSLSVYRALEYEALPAIPYHGRLLDFGGGETANYAKALKEWMGGGVYEAANISSNLEPTYLIEPNGGLPCESGRFDTVVSFNTLEHVFHIEPTLKELARVLAPGGRVVFAVPFLFRVHGCPDDFHRHTPSWWGKQLEQIGFSDICITPIVWDVLTTGYSVTEKAAPLDRIRRYLVPLFGILYAMIKTTSAQERYPAPLGEKLANFAAGYVITARKSK